MNRRFGNSARIQSGIFIHFRVISDSRRRDMTKLFPRDMCLRISDATPKVLNLRYDFLADNSKELCVKD